MRSRVSPRREQRAAWPAVVLGALLGLGTAAAGGLLSVPLVRFTFYPLWSKTTETA